VLASDDSSTRVALAFLAAEVVSLALMLATDRRTAGRVAS
jgi:hypothetical protein